MHNYTLFCILYEQCTIFAVHTNVDKMLCFQGTHNTRILFLISSKQQAASLRNVLVEIRCFLRDFARFTSAEKNRYSHFASIRMVFKLVQKLHQSTQHFFGFQSGFFICCVPIKGTILSCGFPFTNFFSISSK